MDLETAFEAPFAGIQEREQPGQPVLRVADLVKDEQHRRDAEQHEVPDLGAGREEDHAAEHGHERGHREIRLEQDEQRRRGPSTTMNGSTPFLNSRTCSPFLDASMAHQITTTMRAISEGWKLNGPTSTQRRAPLSVGEMLAGERQERDQQEHERDAERRPGPLAPAPVVEPGQHHQRHAADDRPGELPEGERRADVLAVSRDQAGGAVDGDEADRQQHQRHQREEAGLPAELAGVAHRRHYIASTAARKRSPRCS